MVVALIVMRQNGDIDLGAIAAHRVGPHGHRARCPPRGPRSTASASVIHDIAGIQIAGPTMRAVF